MKLRFPACFEDFHCIAATCPDSCCKEWDVLVDDASAQTYQTMPGALGDALRRHLYQEDGRWYFAIEDGRCPMWRQDGLCRIQAEVDHDALCKTCREFPRLTHDYGDFIEYGLELSCPEVARMLFAGADTRWVEQEVPGGEAAEYDALDMQFLLQTREQMLQILSDTTRPLQETLALALLYGYRAQDLLDGGEVQPFDAEAELHFGRSAAKPGDLGAIVDFYRELEILTDAWKHRLDTPAYPTQWDARLRVLTRYGVERYWLQAISDFDLVGRVKMILLSAILVHALGGDTVETAQLYAKEIENNADNVDAILDGAYTCPAFTDDKLLGLLLL